MANDLQTLEARLALQNQLLAGLSAAHRADAEPDLAASARRVAAAGAQGLAVPRCSVWLLDDAHAALRCIEAHDPRPDARGAGTEVAAAMCPSYFAALESSRALAIDDVMTDPRTAELVRYNAGQGIASMLDAPILVGGRLVGIVCHESFSARRWTPEDQSFAGAMAEHVALTLEGVERRKAEDRLRLNLRAAGVERVSLGQYLRPTRYHLPVLEYVTPEQFQRYGEVAKEIGFSWVKAGPMVRSSYHAETAAG